MSAPVARRGFLRDFVGLPLLGGSLTIIGAPSAVAAPITENLLDSYDAWLEYERRSLQWERHRNIDMVHRLHRPFVMQMLRANGEPIGEARACDYIPAANDGASWHNNGEPPPSTRAALVLSTVGCTWEGL